MNTAIYTQSRGRRASASPCPPTSSPTSTTCSSARAQGHPRLHRHQFRGPPGGRRPRLRLQQRRARPAVQPGGPRPRRASSPTTSSSPSMANPSRMATNWSTTSPPARSAPPSTSASCAMAPQDTNVTIADRAKLFADVGNQNDDNAAPAESDAGEGKLGITVTALPAAVSSKLGIKGGVIVRASAPAPSLTCRDFRGAWSLPTSTGSPPQTRIIRCRGQQAQDRRRCGLRGD